MLIPASILSLADCCADESLRYHMTAVHFEREADGRCRATATNNPGLVTIDWLDSEDRQDAHPHIRDLPAGVPGYSRLIDRAALARVKELIASSGQPTGREHYLHLDETAGAGRWAFTFCDRDGQRSDFTGKADDGKFPPWREIEAVKKAMPLADGHALWLDPNLLVMVTKALLVGVYGDDMELAAAAFSVNGEVLRLAAAHSGRNGLALVMQLKVKP